MLKQTTRKTESSSIIWNNLEAIVRMKVREFIQGLLEAEVEDLLGRQKSERRKLVDSPPVYRNGYGKERKLTLGNGTITLQRPRVRGLEERFQSQVLPLFARRTPALNQLLPQLYLHGLALGDFDLALRGLLGKEAPISAGTIARLKEKWQIEWQEWRQRSLVGLEVVYCWADGIYVKAGLEKNKAALLVVIGGLSNGQKVVLAVEPGYRESIESWSSILRDLKSRGMNQPRLVVGDGNLGLWGALSNVYPGTGEQRWRMVTFYQFPQEHWVHLRTTNIVESPFAGLRLRTAASKRYKKVENATAVIWKMLLVAEQRFRRLNAPEKLQQVFQGTEFPDGIEVKNKAEEVLALA